MFYSQVLGTTTVLILPRVLGMINIASIIPENGSLRARILETANYEYDCWIRAQVSLLSLARSKQKSISLLDGPIARSYDSTLALPSVYKYP